MPARYFLNSETQHRVRVRTRGYLPHWELDNGTYFVTFREADSLPRHVVERLRTERQAIRRNLCGNRNPTAVEQAQIAEQFGVRLDAELDVGRGRCSLRDHAAIATGALKHFDGSRYELIAWTVMPNHVHAVFTAQESLADIMHSWKSYIAQQVGRPLFTREYFDRLIRDENDLDRTVTYVRDNPRKAGLIDWPYVG